MKENKARKCNWKRWLSVLLVLLLVVTPLGYVNVKAATNVCEMGGTQYASLDEALIAAQLTGLNTIRLLDNINYSDTLIVNGKHFAFDLNGYTLELNNTNANSNGLTVFNGGTVTITGTGSLNVTGIRNGIQVDGAGSEATVTNVSCTGVTGNFGVLAANNAKVTVLKDVTGRFGIYTSGSAEVEVGQNVVSNDPVPSNSFIACDSGGHIHVGGNVTGGGQILATNPNSTIEIDGNVQCSPALTDQSITSSSAHVHVAGNVSGGAGIYAQGAAGSITVDGDVTTSLAGNQGAYAYNGASITIGGRLQGTLIGARAVAASIVVKGGNVVATAAGGIAVEAEYGSSIEIQNGSALGGRIGVVSTGSSDGTDNGTPSTVTVFGNASGGEIGVDVTNHKASAHIGGNAQGGSLGVYVTQKGGATVDGDVTGGTGIRAEDSGSYVTVGGNVTGLDNDANGVEASNGANVSVGGNAKNDQPNSFGVYSNGNGGVVMVQGDVVGDSGAGGGGAWADNGGTITVEGIISTGGTYARIDSYLNLQPVRSEKTSEDFDTLLSFPARGGYFTYSDSERTPKPTYPTKVRVKTTLTVTTGEPQVSEGEAKLSGSADAGRGPSINGNVMERGFIYSFSPNLNYGDTDAATIMDSNSGPGSFSGTIPSVQNNKTYYVRAYAVNGAGIIQGEVKTFSGGGNPPVIKPPVIGNISITNQTASGVTLSGSATAGSNGIIEYGFVYGTSANPTLTTGTKVSASGSAGSFTATLSGLSAATHYYVRGYATDSKGTVYGADTGFITHSTTPATPTPTAPATPTPTTPTPTTPTPTIPTPGGGFVPTGSPAGTEKIIVDVKEGNTDNTLSQIIMERATTAEGRKSDTLIYEVEKVKETVKKLKENGKDTARIVIPDAKGEVAQTKVNLPSESIKNLADGGINLGIDTSEAKLDLSKDSLNKAVQTSGDNLYFSLVPVKDENQKKNVMSHAVAEAVMVSGKKNSTASVFVNPITIETNMSNIKAGITLPLTGITIPSSSIDREKLLQQLAAYIEYSDGSKELVQGELVVYKEGLYGIHFNITKSGTFTLVKTDAFVKASDCDIIKVTAPSKAVIKGTGIKASVANKVKSITIKATVSENATWVLYSNKACTRKVANNKLKLKTGFNTAYIKVTAEDGTSKIYKLTITRNKPSGAM